MDFSKLSTIEQKLIHLFDLLGVVNKKDPAQPKVVVVSLSKLMDPGVLAPY
jgi:hypothetical protein